MVRSTLVPLARLLVDTDDECGSPSWDRGNANHSPLAALMRREFPRNTERFPVPAGGGAKLHSERRLFDDL